MSAREALRLGLVLSALGVDWAVALDPLYGLVVFASLFFDVVVYTIWLKRRTPWAIIWATYLFATRQPQAYRAALIALVSGLVIGGLHMATSRALRGSSMPKDFIVYATALTLVVFLLFHIPGIWNRISLTGKESHTIGLGAGSVLIVAGIAIVTVDLWGGPTHTLDGINYARFWSVQLSQLGAALIAAGLSVWVRLLLKGTGRRMLPNRAQESSHLIS